MRALVVVLSLAAAGAIAGCVDPGIQIVVTNESSLCLRATYALGPDDPSIQHYLGPTDSWDVVAPGQTRQILNTLGSAPTRVYVRRPDGTEVGTIDGPHDGVFVVTVRPDLTLAGESRDFADSPITGRGFAADTACRADIPTSPSQHAASP